MHLFADPCFLVASSPTLYGMLACTLIRCLQVLPSVVVQEAKGSAEVKAAVLQVLVQVREG